MTTHVLTDSAGGSFRLKTEADDDITPITDDIISSRGHSPLSDSMMTETDDDGFNPDDVITHEVTHDAQEGESVITTETFGADLQRTLGEILAYCQVTYGAILKLDEKFEMLQAKVANIQSFQQNPAHLSQSFQSRTDYSSSQQQQQQHHESSPHQSVKNKKSLMPPPDPPEVKKPVCQNQQNNTESKAQEHLFIINKIKQQMRVKSSKLANTEINNSTPPITSTEAKWSIGNHERNVFLPKSIVQKAGRMTRPSAATRYLLRNLFTTDELSKSSTNGNPTRQLKRLDPNKISAIREWAVKKFPKYDLREKGKDWKICLSVMNSTSRYFRFLVKTRTQKMNPKESFPSETSVSSEHTAEIDVELSDSDNEEKYKINSAPESDKNTKSNYNSDASCYVLDGSLPKQVYLGPPHREVKIPEFALSAAHLRTRPELIARYLIKFIFPEDVLVYSNVYGARRGIQPLDYNKISALREYLSERFPWMKLEEDGSDWKVCVGAINSTIRKFRYEYKMGIKKKKRQL